MNHSPVAVHVDVVRKQSGFRRPVTARSFHSEAGALVEAVALDQLKADQLKTLSLFGGLFAVVLIAMALLLSSTNASAQSGEFPKTDFETRSVELSEIMSGGPPRDGIPPIDTPVFVSIAEAGDWLKGDEPVIYFEHEGDARAYPLQILIFHEIVNDVVGEKPVSVTFCPLCNASIVFDRQVEGELLDFGTTGRLRRSDLIMYDRQSETWWQQFTGTGIVGKYTDTELVQLNSQIISFDTFRKTSPAGKVLSKDTGYLRRYGENPYAGYDSIDSKPFLYRGELDPRLPPMERIISIPDGDGYQLLALSALKDKPVVNTSVSTGSVVVLATTQATSALDKTSIAKSRKVPAAAAFDASVDGKVLTFEFKEGVLLDQETGSVWSPLGVALDGKLKGKRLKQLDRGVHFAFAWLAFDPDAKIFTP